MIQASTAQIGWTPAPRAALVEADPAEQIGRVGHGQRRLMVGGRGGDRVIEPDDRIRDREPERSLRWTKAVGASTAAGANEAVGATAAVGAPFLPAWQG